MASNWKNPSWKWLLAGLLVASVILVIVAFQPLKDFAWSLRAQMLLNASEEAHAEGNAQVAFQKGLSAHYLDPDNQQILLNLARRAVDFRHVTADRYWPQTVNIPGRTPEDLKSFLQYAMSINDFERARRYINLLNQELPDDPEVGMMQVNLFINQRRMLEAMNLARSLLDKGVESVELHTAYAQALLSVPREETLRLAREHLSGLAGRDDETGLAALRLLFRSNQLTEAERATLSQRYIAHPLSERQDKLVAYRAALNSESQDFASSKEAIYSLFDLENLDDKAQLVEFLIAVNQPQEVVELVSEDEASLKRELFRGLLIAKLALKEGQEVLEMTLISPDRNPLSSAETMLLRARAHQQLGNVAQFQETVNLLADVADIEAGNLDDFMMTEAALVSMKQWPNLLKLYRRLSQTRPFEAVGKQKLLYGYYIVGDGTSVADMLEDVDYDDFQDQPSAQNFLAYLNMLHRRDITPHRTKAEQLLAEYPSVIDFRLTLSLAYLLNGRPQDALSLLEGLPTFDETTPRYFRVISASVMEANGQLEQARDLLGDLNTQDLLQAEQRLLADLATERDPQVTTQ